MQTHNTAARSRGQTKFLSHILLMLFRSSFGYTVPSRCIYQPSGFLLNSKFVGTIRKHNTVTSDSDLYLVFIMHCHQYEKWLCKEELQKTMTYCPNNMQTLYLIGKKVKQLWTSDVTTFIVYILLLSVKQ